MKRIVVPEGMLKAAIKVDTGIDPDGSDHQAVIEAALRWLSENPIIPTEDEFQRMLQIWDEMSDMDLDKDWRRNYLNFVLQKWHRIMFLAPPCKHKNVNKYPNFTNALETVTGVKSPAFSYFCTDCGEQVPEPEEVFIPQHPDPIIEQMNHRMAEYSDWIFDNMARLGIKKPLEPRLEWDKPGRKLFTYGDVVKK